MQVLVIRIILEYLLAITKYGVVSNLGKSFTKVFDLKTGKERRWCKEEKRASDLMRSWEC